MNALVSPLARVSRALRGRRSWTAGFVVALLASVASAFAQLYSENFDDGVANSWTVISGTWTIPAGTDRTYQNTISELGPDISVYGGATWDTGYTFATDVRLYGTGYANQVGVVYYYKDASNYYEVQLGGALDPNHGNTNLHLYEHVGGVVTQVDGNFTSPGSGNFVTLTIARSGTTTTIKVAGTTILTRTQSALTGGGKIGAANRWALGWFNNVVVTDSAAPTVALSAPANGASVAGSSVTVSANASDNIGVVGVQFKLDGANLGSEDTTSPYGVTWNSTTATNGSHALTAVARDAAGNTATSSAVNVTVNNLPSPWQSQDIGAVGAAGSASASAGTFTVAGAGAGIWWTADEFRFVYQQLTGDCRITARVATVQNTGAASGWEHAGIMIRDSLGTNAMFSGLYETSTRGLLFEERAATGANASGVASDGATVPPSWIRLERSGNTFTAYSSADGSAWTAVGSHTASTWLDTARPT